MIVAQQCGTNVLHKAYRSLDASNNEVKQRAVTGCGQVVEYGSWGVYELKGKNLFARSSGTAVNIPGSSCEECEFCPKCFPQ